MDLDIKIPVFTRGNDGRLRREKTPKQAKATAPSVSDTATPNEPKARKTVQVRERTEKRASGSVHTLVENWTPRARVLLIARQTCACCGEKVEYVAGDLIEYTERDKVAGVRTIRTRAFNRMVDARYAWEALPRRVDYLEESVQQCGKCIRVDEIFETMLEDKHSVQIQMPLAL